MLSPRFDRLCKLAARLMLAIAVLPVLADAPMHYEPTLESLNRIPFQAGMRTPSLEFSSTGDCTPFQAGRRWSIPTTISPPTITLRTIHMRSGISTRCDRRLSARQAYHREHYGAKYDYYNFAPIFDREIQKWNPDTWAKVFQTRERNMWC